MIKIEIPGKGIINVEHIVLDYNGTMAVDGNIIPGVKEKLNMLSTLATIHVISADTFGKAEESVSDICCNYISASDNDQAKCKRDYIAGLGADSVIAIGNGVNDSLMLKDAAIGIALIQQEGASTASIINADIICTNINDALDMILHPLRIAATLRM